MQSIVGKQIGMKGLTILFTSNFSETDFHFRCQENFDPKEEPYPGKNFNKIEVECLRDWLTIVLENYEAGNTND